MVASLFKKMKQQKPVRWTQYRVTCPCISQTSNKHYFNIMSVAAQSAFLHCRPSCIFLSHAFHCTYGPNNGDGGSEGWLLQVKQLSLTTIQKLQHQTTACSGDFFPQKFALCFIFFMMMMSTMIIKIIMMMTMMMMMAADGFGMFCPSCFSFALRPGEFLFLLWDFVRHALFHGGFPNSKREMIFRKNAETAKATQVGDFWSVAGPFGFRNMK